MDEFSLTQEDVADQVGRERSTVANILRLLKLPPSVQRLLSDGWLVAYLEYESDAADALPTLVELRREDIEVRLKIDEWLLPQ